MPLENLLERIPFLGGYEAQRQQNEASGLNQLRQATGTVGLLQSIQQQQKKAQFTADLQGLGPNPSHEDVIRLAVKSGLVEPKDLAVVMQGAENKKAQVDATREATMMRLAQQAQQYENTFNLRLQAAKTTQEKNDLLRQREAFHQQQAIEASRLGGAKANYNFGTPLGAPLTPTVPMTPTAPTVQPNAAPVQVPPASPSNFPRETPPDAAAAKATPMPDAGNLDARDLMARAAPQPQAVAPPPPAAPAGSVNLANMPPEIKALPLREQAKWLQAQSKPSIAGAVQFTPQTLEFTAKQYLAGDRQSIQGFARNATARVALQNAIVDEAAKQKLSPEEVASKMAEFQGIVSGSRTVGQRAANINLAATEAKEMIGIVKETSDQFSRTNFVPWNMALRAYESGTGSPEIAKFGASINALVNVYARAINPTGVPTVSDKEHARAVINTVQSPQQVDAVLGIIGRELDIAQRAPAQARQGIRASVTGNSQPSTTRSGVTVSNW